MTNVTDANNFFEITKAINDLSGGLVALLILATFFFIIFIVYKKYEQDTKEVFLVDSLITAIIAVLFWGIGLIGWNIVIYPIIMLFAGIIIYQFSD